MDFSVLLFSRAARTFLDGEDERWILETFAWLNHQIQPCGWLASRPVILPTSEFFPPTELEGQGRAEFIFDCVRRHMGMLDWACTLVAQPRRREMSLPGIPFHGLMHQEGAAGTFGQEGNAAVITYDPGELAHPIRLIAVLAHELAHYRLAAISADIPGGVEMTEQATDLTALAFGFGVFGANAAFDFAQTQDFQTVGWQTRRLGYLSERVWIFGIAVLLLTSKRNPQIVGPYLKAHLRSDLRSALKSIRQRPNLLAKLKENHG